MKYIPVFINGRINNMEKAKIFTAGRSWAAGLLKKFRFNVKGIMGVQLAKSIVSPTAFKGWKQLFDNITIIPNNDFLQERNDTEPQSRECFKLN